MKQPPNFLVIMTDQQRADHLGCYGNPIVKTPTLDTLAARGIRFDQFYVSNPICQPNRAALATGQLTTVNGCRKNGIPLSLNSTTYADVLRGAGYRTGLVGKAHFQNVSPMAALTPTHRGIGRAPTSPFDLSMRAQRSGPNAIPNETSRVPIMVLTIWRCASVMVIRSKVITPAGCATS